MDATNARRSTTTIIGQLNREWEQMRQDASIEQTLHRWAEQDERLGGAARLADLEAIARRPVTEETDLFFASLLERAVRRDEDGDLAARIVVQLMLGRVVISAYSLTGWVHDSEEQAQLVVAAMWETIRNFPIDKRKRYITPYLAWTTHHRAKRQAQPGCREIPLDIDEINRIPAEENQMNASEELTKLLAWSLAESILNPAEADLLMERYGTSSPGRKAWSSLGDPDRIATSIGATPAAMRQRCSRAARKLSKAAARYIATNVF
ncbi:sigma-70 RNA polymerase sigma factor region 4 domain-containing protein [Allosalinactinospora lopnorensis]|uniref:sigma-70 family RNA polymerase sigma factor n=1 Tax=Allosalinactinospora lopnorensis TaxID=1352348 RepID=UPI000623C30F|nr:sigma-70 family RNA polymerase sigma factor [Allosalinactinospora lopnorensis]